MVLKCFNRSIPINLLEDGKKIKNGAHLFITSPCCITVGRKETETTMEHQRVHTTHLADRRPTTVNDNINLKKNVRLVNRTKISGGLDLNQKKNEYTCHVWPHSTHVMCTITIVPW